MTFPSCRHRGCQLAGVKSCRCFGPQGGGRVARPPSYVVWAMPTHPSRSWAVGHEIRPGCLKVVAYADSKLLADALAKRLGDGDSAAVGREAACTRNRVHRLPAGGPVANNINWYFRLLHRSAAALGD